MRQSCGFYTLQGIWNSSLCSTMLIMVLFIDSCMVLLFHTECLLFIGLAIWRTWWVCLCSRAIWYDDVSLLSRFWGVLVSPTIRVPRGMNHIYIWSYCLKKWIFTVWMFLYLVIHFNISRTGRALNWSSFSFALAWALTFTFWSQKRAWGCRSVKTATVWKIFF